MMSSNLSPEFKGKTPLNEAQQRLISLISKGLGLFVSPAFGFISGKGAPSGTVMR